MTVLQRPLEAAAREGNVVERKLDVSDGQGLAAVGEKEEIKH